jgi:hypothetical protein
MLFNVFERRFNIFGFPFGHKISTSSYYLWLWELSLWFCLRLFFLFFVDGFALKLYF